MEIFDRALRLQPAMGWMDGIRRHDWEPSRIANRAILCKIQTEKDEATAYDVDETRFGWHAPVVN